MKTTCWMRPSLFSLLGVLWAAVVAAAQPVIIQQPNGTNLSAGGTAVFIVAATNAPFNYQWRLNGSNLNSSTNATLTITNVTITNAGLYRVTVFNASGAADSAPAILRLTNFPQIAFSDSFPGLTNNNNSFIGRGTNNGATKQSGEPRHAGLPGGKSVWITWLAPEDGVVTFRTLGSSFDTLLAAYTGNALTNLVEVDADDDSGGWGASMIRFNATEGTLYRIAVDGFLGAKGDIILEWDLESTATFLPVIAVQPQSQTVTLNDPVTFTVQTTLPSLHQWFLNGDPIPGATSGTLDINTAHASDVGRYFVRVSRLGRTVDSRVAHLQINLPGPGSPLENIRSGDKLGHAALDFYGSGLNVVAHGYSGAQIFTTTSSGKDDGEPNHCSVLGGASEWFAFQADTNGTLYLNTDGSSFDTVLAVYIGPGDSYVTLTNVTCDNNSGTNGKTSKLSLTATTGTIYWIAVDGVNSNTPPYGAARGSVTLNYRLVQPLTLTNLSRTTNNNGRLIFKVNGTPNLATKIQASTNLGSTNWTSLFTNTPVSGSFNYTNTNNAVFPRRFFRAIQQF